MTLKEAFNFFESLKTKTTKKSEIKVYEKLLHILNALKDRTFTKDEMQSIEMELGNLSLKSNPDNRKKFFKKALSKFETYLKETFSLTSKGHYTKMSVSLGLLFGVVLGVLIGQRFEKSMGLSFGICIGMFIGAFIGRRMDSQAKATGNLL
jgi:F0F1-type ATP synthase assembly protein I